MVTVDENSGKSETEVSVTFVDITCGLVAQTEFS